MVEYNKGNKKWGHKLEAITELPEISEERSNGSTGNYVNGSMRERAEARKNKKDLEVFVGGLPFDVNEQKLAEFLRDNRVNTYEIKILYGDDGRSKGLGFVLCKSLDDAKKALNMNGRKMG